MYSILDDMYIYMDPVTYLIFTLGVQTGVEHISGNMFESVPSGCDAFLMKVTIHNLFTAINLLVLTGFRKNNSTFLKGFNSQKI